MNTLLDGVTERGGNESRYRGVFDIFFSTRIYQTFQHRDNGFFLWRVMQHHFEIEDAEKYGIEKAILIEHFRFWIQKNISSGKNKHDGHTWTFNSARAYGSLFPYLSEHQAYRHLRELVEMGVLLSGNYNKTTYDRTKWYALKDETFAKSNSQSCKIHLAESQNGFHGIVKPIPDRKPDRKPDKEKNAYSDEFEIFWKEYPRNINKAGAFKVWKARLKEGVAVDTLMGCLVNYKGKLKTDKTEPNFILHAKTFLNADHRFEDYGVTVAPEAKDYTDKNGNVFKDGERTGHWDGGRFIPVRGRKTE